MFWPFILPIQLTAGLISLLIACVTLAAPLLRWRRTTTLCATFLLGLLAFIPSCLAITSVLDAKRFGLFDYEAVDSELYALHFGDLNWPFYAGTSEYYRPEARNSAGFSLWFSESAKTAYLVVGYW